jgi:hypothetical protein
MSIPSAATIADPIPFFVNAAAGTSAVYVWRGGYMYVSATATFGSVVIQLQDPSGNWIPVTGTTITSNGMTVIQIPEGLVRAVASGGSAYYVYGMVCKTRTRH